MDYDASGLLGPHSSIHPETDWEEVVSPCSVNLLTLKFGTDPWDVIDPFSGLSSPGGPSLYHDIAVTTCEGFSSPEPLATKSDEVRLHEESPKDGTGLPSEYGCHSIDTRIREADPSRLELPTVAKAPTSPSTHPTRGRSSRSRKTYLGLKPPRKPHGRPPARLYRLLDDLWSLVPENKRNQGSGIKPNPHRPYKVEVIIAYLKTLQDQVLSLQKGQIIRE